MARRDKDDEHQVYYIPWNYDEAGGVIGGKVKTRNAIEAFVLCAPIAFLEYHLLKFSIEINIIIALVTLLPLLFLCIFGLGGETISQIIMAFVRYRQGRRKLSYISFVDDLKRDNKKKSVTDMLDSLQSGGIKALANDVKSNMQNSGDGTKQPKQKGKKPNRLASQLKKSRHTSKPHGGKAKPVVATANAKPATNAQEKPAKPAKPEKPVSHNSMYNVAWQETLLRKLELLEEDESWPLHKT